MSKIPILHTPSISNRRQCLTACHVISQIHNNLHEECTSLLREPNHDAADVEIESDKKVKVSCHCQ